MRPYDLIGGPVRAATRLARKSLRRLQLSALERVDVPRLKRLGEREVVRRFKEVARRVPAYRDLLRNRGVDPGAVRDFSDFSARCPVIEKADIFGRLPIDHLCLDGRLSGLAQVLTSSGQRGGFAFGLSTQQQNARAADVIELGLQHAFGTDDYRTLLINALPMGVRFHCRTATVAETSVREDMVSALVREFGPYHEQVILVLDPLFGKRLLDHGREIGLDWSLSRIHVILGEETFGEFYRRYMARCLGQEPEGWSRGFVGSSMGVAELGLNLFFETRQTVTLRQTAQRHPHLLRTAIGDWPGWVPPMLFVYDPRRIFVEVHNADRDGFGDLTVSTLDRSQLLPLLRYRTGDRARLLDHSRTRRALDEVGLGALELPPLPLVAVCGRREDMLPDGRSLLDFKDALYRDGTVADQLSGAFRVSWTGRGCHVDVQTRPGWQGDAGELAARIRPFLHGEAFGSRDSVTLRKASDFSLRFGLDYERKFEYLSAAGSGSPSLRSGRMLS